ncbi:MAG: hypothetical protein KIT22_07050 [Verrucomicrobiae bacterium]|nr:hypothetical protein [Verrucomicrobiae bacterium]
MNPPSAKRRHPSHGPGTFWAVVAAALLFATGYAYIVTQYLIPDARDDRSDAPPTSSVWERRGQLGDMFGGLNALFSGLAFAGLVYALVLQRQQLLLQQIEIEDIDQSVKEQRRIALVAAVLQAQAIQIKVYDEWIRTYDDLIKSPATDAERESYKNQQMEAVRQRTALQIALNELRSKVEKRLESMGGVEGSGRAR